MKQIFLLLAFSFAFLGLQAQNVAEQQTPLITKITATWCTNCGSWGWDFFEHVLDDNKDKAIMIGAHPSGDLGSTTGKDFNDNFSAIGQPKFYVNSTDVRVTRNAVATKRTEVAGMVDDMIAQSPLANVGFYAEIKDGNINVRTKTKFFQNGGIDSYNLGLYVIENGVMNTQSSQSGVVSHPNVMRASFTAGSFGETLDISGSIAAGTEISRDFSVAIDSKWNTDNVSVVAIIWKQNGNKFEFVNASQTNDFSGIPTSDIDVISAVEGFESFPTVVTETATVEVNLTEALENIQMNIFDLSGKKLATLFNGNLPSGTHTFQINRNDFNASGIYFLALKNEGKVMMKKLILE